MSDLPSNVILNKVSTGCGGTSVALQSKSHYVIAVPFKAMIKNKMKWAKEKNIKLQPVMGGISDSEILKFDGDKYICTYDSLGRITKILGDKVVNYKILIDEAHKLVDSGAFRGDAIRTVIDNYLKYKSFTFMTATPVPREYQLPELADIPEVKIQWDNLKPVVVDYITLKKDFNKSIAEIAADYLDGKYDKKNMHTFINSVKSIIEIVAMLNKGSYDTLKNVNIVCADNDRNSEIIERHLGYKYTISKVGDVAKVNFYTATAFEGSDIYDKYGVTYVATNGHHDHTKIDILTTLPQIAGRIRDSKYKNKITLLYIPHKGILDLSEEEFAEVVKEHLAVAKKSVEAFNSLNTEIDRIAFKKGHRDNQYLLESNDKLIVNTTAWYAQMAAYHTIHSTYYAGGFSEASGTYNDVTYVYSEKELEVDNQALKNVKLTGSANFKELCELYFKAVEEGDYDTRIEIASARPLIEEAYEKIGAEKMKALKFVQKKIREEIAIQTKFSSKGQTIVKMLNLKPGSFITGDQIRDKLRKVYKRLGINKPLFLISISEWYDVTRTTRIIDDEKISGYLIVAPKFKPKE